MADMPTTWTWSYGNVKVVATSTTITLTTESAQMEMSANAAEGVGAILTAAAYMARTIAAIRAEIVASTPPKEGKPDA